ncbi:ribonuclease H-like domain-containing protein [Rhizophagus clarus]|uniref:Ribonuclease H-like domain-containing protein n=1 Tax=Rhizophagus clarus TaxID=94130 RepID=A0A8H3LQY2_9GLOM|nr:ribonuclease H-like domain-containing protein [Rhizophagus clarus]
MKINGQLTLNEFHDKDQPLPKGKSDRIDKALTRFFTCCDVSFRIVESPFFLDFLQELNSAYSPFSRDILTKRLFEEELGYVNSKVLRELEVTKNLTLALDGWSSLNHLSIWNFTILTPTNKEYIYQLLDLSSNSHTGEFIAEKIEDILIRVGAEKFSAIVSDNGSNVRKARGIIQSKHPYIEDVRCISHCVNLISCDIVKHPFAENLLKKINILANFFRNNAMAGAKLRELIKSMNVKGGGIVPFCKTRWTTAFQSISDIIRLKAVLEELASTNYSNILSNEKIKPIIRSWNFFNDLKVLAFILKPLCDTILLLERSSANLSDCYLGMACIAASMKKLPRTFNQEFKNHCISMINKRLEEFDDDNYLLAFFLHPRFRTCLKYGVWQRIVIIAGKVAKNAGMNLECSRILCSQLLMYKNNERPFNQPYSNGIDDPIKWWTSMELEPPYLQSLALRRLQLGVERLESIAKIISYYRSNAHSEFRFYGKGTKKESLKLSDSEINAIVNDSLAELEPEEEDDDVEIIKEIQV